MTITIERKTAKDGSVYWTVEHADTEYRMVFDQFADVIGYLDAWKSIQGIV